MRNLFTVLVLLVIATCLASSLLFSQTVKYRFPVTVTDSGIVVFSQRLDVGLHPNATLCLDTVLMTGFTDHWTESDSSSARELEGPPPSPAADIRFTSSCNPQPYTQDIRHFTDTNQVDTLKFKISLDNTHGENNVAVKFRWPHVLSQYADSVILVKSTGVVKFRVNMAAQDSFIVYYSIATNGTSFGNVFVIIKGPKVPPPPPAAVVPVFPSMGQQDVPLSFNFTWNAVSQAYFYKFQLATDSLFSTVIASSSQTGTSVPVSGLQQYTTYYWRVLVSNPYGFSYYQNPVLRFRTLSLIPGVPALISPADGATDIPTSGTTLQWGASTSSTPVTYHVQLSTDQNFLSNIVAEDSTLSGLTYPTPALTNCLKYYWRVRGKNSAGLSAYSAPRMFRGAFASTSVPGQLSPLNGATGVPISPTLTWSADSCSIAYNVQVSRDAAFSMIFIDQVSAITSVSIGPLGQDSVYYWRVNSMNTLDTSAYSPVDSFRTKLLPAAAPLLASPANGDTLVPALATIMWHPVKYATRYQLQISKNPSFVPLIEDDSTLTDTSKPESFVNCVKYYWRVRALNDSGSAGFSATRNFSVLHLPGPPVGTSPVNGSLGIPLNTTLIWTADDCARAFHVQVSRDAAFTMIFIDQSSVAPSLPIGPLGQDSVYYWRVNSMNAVDTSSYSTVDSFKTKLLPAAAPLLASPANGDTLVPASATIIWHPAKYATHYRLQISKSPSFVPLIEDDSTLTDTSKQESFVNCVKYYWRVSAINDSGSAGFSATRNFSVLHLPGAPDGTSPVNGSFGIPLHTTLIWTADDCARAFRVQLSNDAQFSQLKINQIVTAATSLAIGPLVSDTMFYWRVKSLNAVDSSQFGTVDSFRTTGTISGTKWNDLNFNGVQDPSEPGLGGWTIEVHGDSCSGPLVAADTTDGSGQYAIELPPGTYGVREVLKPGYGQSYPDGNCTTVSLFHNVTNINFGNYLKNSVSGTTYRDANNNGVRDSAETTVDGFVIRLTADSAHGFAADSVVSAGGGSFSFTDLSPGTYTLTERPAAGWTISQPSGGTYILPLLTGMNLTGKNFGNYYLGDDSTYRTWTYAQLSADTEKKPIKAPRPGKTIHVPNSANLLVGLMKADSMKLPVGLLNIPIPGTRKIKCYLYPKKQSDVFTTFNTRGIKHGQFAIPPPGPGPIDFNNKFKRLYGKKANLTAKVHDNILMAELLTLKVNLAASFKHRTNAGLGELEYYGPDRIQGRPLMTVQEIANYGDSIMTNWESVDPAAYPQLYNIVHAINGAFTTSTTGDTTPNGGWFTGGGRLKWASVVKVQSTGILQQPKQGVHNHPQPQVEEFAPVPDEFELAQNYPNPFNPVTTIRFNLPVQSLVTLKVYNVLGQEVTTVYDNELIDAGEEEIDFDGTRLASGIYFYRLTAAGIDDESGQSSGQKFTSVKKMMLIK